MNKTLELRRDPHVRSTATFYRYGSSIPDFRPDDDLYVAPLMQEILGDLQPNWLYTALIETVFDGPEPSWSKDDWSFIPLDLSNIPRADTTGSYEDVRGTSSIPQLQSVANVTFETMAIRAKLECAHIEQSEDTSQWASVLDSDAERRENEFSEHEAVYLLNKTIFQHTGHWTTATPHRAIPICCANLSDIRSANQSKPMAALGFWTTNYPSDLAEEQSALFQSTGNFTIKWIRGVASMQKNNPRLYGSDVATLYFSARPDMQALNCRPVIESNTATVTVDSLLGQVQSYKILNTPQPELAAWSDAFVLRGLATEGGSGNISDDTRRITHNMTTRWELRPGYHSGIC
jgi:hypothetical protein